MPGHQSRGGEEQKVSAPLHKEASPKARPDARGPRGSAPLGTATPRLVSHSCFSVAWISSPSPPAAKCSASHEQCGKKGPRGAGHFLARHTKPRSCQPRPRPALGSAPGNERGPAWSAPSWPRRASRRAGGLPGRECSRLRCLPPWGAREQRRLARPGPGSSWGVAFSSPEA